MSINGNEETHVLDLNSIQFTCNSIIHCLCTINSGKLGKGKKGIGHPCTGTEALYRPYCS